MDTFSFNPSKTSSEQGRLFLAVTRFEETNSVFKVTKENSSFSITTPVHWTSESGKETIDKPNEQLELRSQHHIGKDVKEFDKKGWMTVEKFSLPDLDNFQNDIFDEINFVN